MARITSPATVSTEFGISEKRLVELGVVNVSLNADTQLFIDPMLLRESLHQEVSKVGADAYDERFKTIIKLLKASRKQGDAAWKAAEKLLRFPEISWTCLGYGSSTKGSGFGRDLVATTLDTASQIVAMGVEDVDLFMVLALFEEGIGPDRISDMTTNIIIRSLLDFTLRASQELGLVLAEHKTKHGSLLAPTNPYSGDPLVFVPRDIVRELPVAADWSDISRVVNENEQLRDRVNQHVGGIWATMTRAEKRRLRDAALQSKEAFEQMLFVLRQVDTTPYDFAKDRNGETFWAGVGQRVNCQYPFDLSRFGGRRLDVNDVEAVVNEILLQFRDLIENKGIWKELWTEDAKPRKEKASQRLFFVIAYAYCKANNLDVTPEADSGNGPVDFKVSKGFKGKVVIEIKLSTGNVVHGYEKQLEVYKKAESTERGVFLLVDVGGMGRKFSDIQQVRNKTLEAGERTSAIWYVDGTQKASASKRG